MSAEYRIGIQRVYTCLTGKPLSSILEMSDAVLAYGTFSGKANEARAFRARWKSKVSLRGNLNLTPYAMGAYLNWAEKYGRGRVFKTVILNYLAYLPCKPEVLRYLYKLSFEKAVFHFDRGNHFGLTRQEICDTGLLAYSPRFRVLVWDAEVKEALAASNTEEMLWLYAEKKLRAAYRKGSPSEKLQPEDIPPS